MRDGNFHSFHIFFYFEGFPGEQDVSQTGAAHHHATPPLARLALVDSQLVPVQDVQGGADGVAEY